jgi:hypothetical protein
MADSNSRTRPGEVKEQLKEELIIGIILSEGLPTETHFIMAEIQPGPTQKSLRGSYPFSPMIAPYHFLGDKNIPRR